MEFKEWVFKTTDPGSRSASKSVARNLVAEQHRGDKPYTV